MHIPVCVHPHPPPGRQPPASPFLPGQQRKIRISRDRTLTTREQATPLSGHSAMRRRCQYGPAQRKGEMVPRDCLRDHLAERHPGQPCRARRHHPRPLGHRRPPALGPRPGLRRGPVPGPHRQRPAGHGHLAEPRHHHLAAVRPRQHRRRPPPPRPPARPATTNDHELLNDFAEALGPCPPRARQEGHSRRFTVTHSNQQPATLLTCVAAGPPRASTSVASRESRRRDAVIGFDARLRAGRSSALWTSW
jgi:hypothetical protein